MMEIQLANKLQLVKPSPTLAVTAKAQELKAAGKDIISLGAGEPDFDTPTHIKDAAIAAINAGHTKYTAVAGIVELKEAILNKLKTDNNLEYSLNQIMVSTGAKQCIYNAMQAILNPQDEVLIPAPYWVSYPDMTKLADAKPVIIETSIENRFKVTAEQLEKVISSKTKMLILNSPSNPTGVAYSEQELKAIAKVLLKHPQITIISDDIYEYILWGDNKFSNVAMACKELQDRTVVINGVSKAYSMTGWRIGYAAGPEKLIKAMSKIQGQSTSNTCSIAQYAAVAALNGNRDCVTTMLKEFKKRHDYVVTELNNIPGINCLHGDGTFYSFFDVSGLIEKTKGINNDTELATSLLEKSGLALVPGSAFGADNFLRLSFATSMDNLVKAIERLKNY